MILTKALGPNYDIEKIKAGVKIMQHSTVNVGTVRSDLGPGINAMTSIDRTPDGRKSATLHFDHNYYMHKTDRERAGTLIHEASHALLRTKDELKVTNQESNVESAISGSE